MNMQNDAKTRAERVEACDTPLAQSVPDATRQPRWWSDADKNFARMAVNRLAKTQGYIYFIRCENFVKIGYSAAPRRRPKEFATCNPFDCVLIGIMSGGTLLEDELHKRYAHLRHRNEWFRAVPELLADIAAMCGDWSQVAPKKKTPPPVTAMLQREHKNPGLISRIVMDSAKGAP